MRWIAFLVLASCAAEPLPTAFRFEGDAEVMETDEGVSCTFYGDVTDVVAADGGWTGQMFGEIFRQRLDASGNPVFEFQALVGGEVSLLGGEARMFGEQGETAMPYWRELEVLEANAVGYDYDGAWNCAPILPGDGPEGDTDLEATGTWTLVPVEPVTE